jgi:predicted RNA binding protein YcfA (HicA-like mRNA interferase family)
LPAVTGSDVVRALRRIGFDTVRQRGSHVFLAHPDGRATVVPVHAGETLGPGLLRKIARDLDMTRDQLIRVLRS